MISPFLHLLRRAHLAKRRRRSMLRNVPQAFRASAIAAPLDAAPLPYPQTPESANAWFISHGICKTHWAQAQGFNRMIVVDLLRGRLRGLRGEAHNAAVALGLKADPNADNKAA